MDNLDFIKTKQFAQQLSPLKYIYKKATFQEKIYAQHKNIPNGQKFELMFH